MSNSINLSNKISRRKTLTSEVTEQLREAITSGSLPPGAKLPTEQQISDQMDVSRTVVREAVAALKADGLVTTKQGVGAFVNEQGESSLFRVDIAKLSSIENVMRLLELRIALETDMAGIAAKRRTDKDIEKMRACLEKINTLLLTGKDSVKADFAFHLAIAESTQNDYFADFVRFMGTKTVPARDLLIEPEHDATYVTIINNEHSAIVEAIAAQDVEKARAMARQHLVNSYNRHASKAGFESQLII